MCYFRRCIIFYNNYFFSSLTGKKNTVSKVRLAFIGVGERGRSHVRQALLRPDVEVTAICDSSPEAIRLTKVMLEKAGRKAPATYGGSDESFREMLKRDDIDGVVIATSRKWHVPMAIAAMEAGKYVGVEVSTTTTLQDSWDLVDASERTGSHCMVLENVCYRRDVMAVLNMIRQGMFGTMAHAHCGYQHTLQPTSYIGAERAANPLQHSADVHSTHGLGPVAHWLNINRGNRFTRLTSMATKSRGLRQYIVDGSETAYADATVNYKLGDVVTTMIECANGENIVLIHDTNSNRPYSTGFRAHGTHGTWLDSNDQISLSANKPDAQAWEPFAARQEKHDHPLWKRYARTAEKPPCGGIDFFIFQDFINSVKEKTAPPIDVYDAAVWSAISPLSELSLAQGGQSVEIPDFTRGKWKTNKPIFGLTDAV
ncbi:Gfo/Idh/MocA family protein [Spirosoma sp. KNUC1025]|uniref:Gfo/Idh/MocA family protein n=1 Tax=Spirosoma sp. KNUC1025 TaxID=2894082 RepID=UPI00386AC923